MKDETGMGSLSETGYSSYKYAENFNKFVKLYFEISKNEAYGDHVKSFFLQN